MKSLTGVIFSRNDNYRGDLLERAPYSINTLVETCDEVFYIDWGSAQRDLIEEIKDQVPKTGKLHIVRVTPEQAKYFTQHDPNPQSCTDVLAKNIGIRRASSEWIITINIDCIVPSKEEFFSREWEKGFYTLSRKEVDLTQIKHISSMDAKAVQEWAQLNWRSLYNQGPSGVGSGDKWSLINCCGDFQLAHRDVWFDPKVRGMEESLTGRGFSDSNVQKKAAIAGYPLNAIFDLPTLHISHPGTFGGTGRINDAYAAIQGAGHTTNTENWGKPNEDFDIYIL